MHLYVHTQSYRSRIHITRDLCQVFLSQGFWIPRVCCSTLPLSTLHSNLKHPKLVAFNGSWFGSRFWRDTHSFQFEPHLILGGRSHQMQWVLLLTLSAPANERDVDWNGGGSSLNKHEFYKSWAWLSIIGAMYQIKIIHPSFSNWTIEIMSQVG